MTAPVTEDSKMKTFAPWTGIPLLVTLGGLGPVVICGIACKSPWMALVGVVFYLVGLIYFLVQTLGRLILRQRHTVLPAALCLLLCSAPGLMITLAVISLGRMFQSEDGFAKDLTIPDNLEVVEPLSEPARGWGGSDDPFQEAILAASSVTPTADPCVVPSMPSLRVLASEHRPLLMRYLASSPAWRVFEQHGVLCATRRWRLGSMWLWKMHGYYSPRDLGFWPGPGIPSFSIRTTIGLDGKPWASFEQGATELKEGTSPQPVLLDKRWPSESDTVVRCGNIVVELFERARGPERRLTKTAVRELEAELKSLLARGEFDRALLPVDSIRRGEAVLNLYKGTQPGIYETEAWINPRESGMVYLKAFEVTRGTQLSTYDLREYSNERTGWSKDPNELFYSDTNITIYEGDWGQPYAARFELWFVPDSGQAERKLLERIFKIEGWQR